MATVGVKPNEISYNSLLGKCSDYASARLVIDEMAAAGIKPDEVTYTTLLGKCSDYGAARQIVDEMVAAGIKPDEVTYTTLLGKCSDYGAARAVLDEMTAAGVKCNEETSTTVVKFLASVVEASELRDFLFSYNAAGQAFYSKIFVTLCQLLTAQELLAWAFQKMPFPTNAFETVVSRFQELGRLDDALRVAVEFPSFPACRKLFREEAGAAIQFFERRLDLGIETHNAAYALGLCHVANDNIPQAVEWLSKALQDKKTSGTRIIEIKRELDEITSR